MKKALTPVILLLTLIVFLYYQEKILNFVMSVFENSKSTSMETIAQINKKKKNVRLKRANSTIWNIAEEEDRLAKQDSLSTGYNSSTLVKFDSGYFLRLGENSYIVIDRPQDDIDISMDKGVLQAKNESAEDQTIRIKTKSSVTEVKGKAEFGVRVNKKDDSSEVWVSKGKAKVVDTSGEETVVKKNEQKQFVKGNNPSYIFQDYYFDKDKNKNKKQNNIDIKKKESDSFQGLSNKTIQKYVSKAKKNINACYLKAKYKYKNAYAGFTITINSNGNVKDVRLSNTSFNDRAVHNCAMFWLKSLKFPSFKGKDIEYNVNIVFQ